MSIFIYNTDNTISFEYSVDYELDSSEQISQIPGCNRSSVQAQRRDEEDVEDENEN